MKFSKLTTSILLLTLIILSCNDNPVSNIDCFGDTNGLAYQDDCGQCVGGNTELNENYLMDECGICGGNGPDNGLNCDGECIGIYDECGICNGNGIDDEACDCLGNVNDECGLCNGNGPVPNYDCDGNCLLNVDNCGICGGDNSSCPDPAYVSVTNQSCDYDDCPIYGQLLLTNNGGETATNVRVTANLRYKCNNGMAYQSYSYIYFQNESVGNINPGQSTTWHSGYEYVCNGCGMGTYGVGLININVNWN